MQDKKASKRFWIMHFGHLTITAGGNSEYFCISAKVEAKLSVEPLPVLYQDDKHVTMMCSFFLSFWSTLNSSTSVSLSQASVMIFIRSFNARSLTLAPSPKNFRHAGSSDPMLLSANASKSSKTIQKMMRRQGS